MVAGDGGEAEEEEVDGGEDVWGGEGAPVGGEVCPCGHHSYWASFRIMIMSGLLSYCVREL